MTRERLEQLVREERKAYLAKRRASQTKSVRAYTIAKENHRIAEAKLSEGRQLLIESWVK